MIILSSTAAGNTTLASQPGSKYNIALLSDHGMDTVGTLPLTGRYEKPLDGYDERRIDAYLRSHMTCSGSRTHDMKSLLVKRLAAYLHEGCSLVEGLAL